MMEMIFDVALRDDCGVIHEVADEPLYALEAFELMEDKELEEGWSWIITPVGTREFDAGAMLRDISRRCKLSEVRIQAMQDQLDAAKRDGNL